MLCSIETISDEKVQKAIQNLKVNFISVDECQVSLVSSTGWKKSPIFKNMSYILNAEYNIFKLIEVFQL